MDKNGSVTFAQSFTGSAFQPYFRYLTSKNKRTVRLKTTTVQVLAPLEALLVARRDESTARGWGDGWERVGPDRSYSKAE